MSPIGDTGEGELAQDPNETGRLYPALQSRWQHPETIPFPVPLSTPSAYATSLALPSSLRTGPVRTDNGGRLRLKLTFRSQLRVATSHGVIYDLQSTAKSPPVLTFSPERNLLLFCAYHDFYLRDLSPEYTTALRARSCYHSSDGWLYYSTISAIYRARIDELIRAEHAMISARTRVRDIPVRCNSRVSIM